MSVGMGICIDIFIGYIFAALGQLSIEKTAVKNGIIRLDNKYYKIKPMDKE